MIRVEARKEKEKNLSRPIFSEITSDIISIVVYNNRTNNSQKRMQIIN